MPQFPITEDRRRILQKIPDYAVDIDVCRATVQVKAGDRLIAESRRALLVRETKHADVYYLPREDVNMSALTPTDFSTYCPFKGHASYWSIGDLNNVVWSYEDPYPEVSELGSYLSFYTDRVSQVTS